MVWRFLGPITSFMVSKRMTMVTHVLTILSVVSYWTKWWMCAFNTAPLLLMEVKMRQQLQDMVVYGFWTYNICFLCNKVAFRKSIKNYNRLHDARLDVFCQTKSKPVSSFHRQMVHDCQICSQTLITTPNTLKRQVKDDPE